MKEKQAYLTPRKRRMWIDKRILIMNKFLVAISEPGWPLMDWDDQLFESRYVGVDCSIKSDLERLVLARNVRGELDGMCFVDGVMKFSSC